MEPFFDHLITGNEKRIYMIIQKAIDSNSFQVNHHEEIASLSQKGASVYCSF